MGADAHGTGHILQSLVVNVAIAIIKAVAAVFTGSGAMMAEAIHSFADTGNQVLLLVGVINARKKPDAQHPLGYGRDVYFWSFIVALMLFTGGGVFSIYEGLHKWADPEPVSHATAGLVILLVSLVLEGGSLLSNVRELHARRGTVPFFRYLRETKDADLVVVFGENGAAVLGLGLATLALGAATWTGDGRWDAAGSLAIGLVLVAVALFLAVEIKSLLLGESADPQTEELVRRMALATPHVTSVLHLLTVQQGPGEVVLAIKLAFAPNMAIEDVCRTIDAFEERVRKEKPEVRWIFVEPDIPRGGTPAPNAQG
jgi:cation diffusion facilitator family transporter